MEIGWDGMGGLLINGCGLAGRGGGQAIVVVCHRDLWKSSLAGPGRE